MEPVTGSAVAGFILFLCFTGLAIIIFGSIGYHLGASEKERDILNRYDLKPLVKLRYVRPPCYGDE